LPGTKTDLLHTPNICLITSFPVKSDVIPQLREIQPNIFVLNHSNPRRCRAEIVHYFVAGIARAMPIQFERTSTQHRRRLLLQTVTCSTIKLSIKFYCLRLSKHVNDSQLQRQRHFLSLQDNAVIHFLRQGFGLWLLLCLLVVDQLPASQSSFPS
jgi:hypothetical protein